MMSLKLINQLEEVFGQLPNTLLFEHQSIQELTEYFIKSYKNNLTELFATKEYIKITTGIESEETALVSKEKNNKKSDNILLKKITNEGELKIIDDISPEKAADLLAKFDEISENEMNIN